MAEDTQIIQIRSQWESDKILFEGKFDSIKDAVEAAIKQGADLRRADLRWADLRWADLRSADLRSANLRWADLRRADLRWADLRWADLRSANLRSADLRWADLRWAKYICLFYCVGENRRYGLAVAAEKSIMVQLGCFWGTEKEAIEAIRAKYGLKTAYEQIIKAACAVVKEQVKGNS